MNHIHLGYEIGTGKAIAIPLGHLAVTGQTQLSGKTTTLEALVSRSKLRAISFITKRAESSFTSEHRIPPYFREQADWQFVSSVFEATLREKVKWERSWIMKVCKGAHSLDDVHKNVKAALEKARGLNESVYTTLDAYLQIVIPQIRKLPYQTSISLQPGINVMDMTKYPSEMQALVIRSAMQWVYEKENNTIVIIPEAWEFLPQRYGSPVKAAAEQLIRKSTAAKNFVWLDSQDLASVEKNIIRQVSIWILGVQREANEIKRVLEHLPLGHPKPRVQDIMTLNKGEFYVCFGRQMHRVYVQPKWMEAEEAQTVAEKISTGAIVDISRPSIPEIGPVRQEYNEQELLDEEAEIDEDEMYKERYEESQRELHEIQASLENALKQIRSLEKSLKEPQTPKEIPAVATAPEVTGSDPDALYASFRTKLLKDVKVLQVLAQQQEVNVRVEKVTVTLEDKTITGRLARMISEGFMNSPVTGNTVFMELKRVAYPIAKPNVYKGLDKLASMGFLTKETNGYTAVKGMKINIVHAKA